MSEELKALEERIEELEAKANPAGAKVTAKQAPFDPTERMGLPKSAVDAMRGVVTDADMQDIRRLRDPSLPKVGGVSAERGSGWVEPRPLAPMPHSELIDRIVESQVGGPNDTSKLK